MYIHIDMYVYIYISLGSPHHSKPYHTHWLAPFAPAAWRNTLCGAELEHSLRQRRDSGNVGQRGKPRTTQSENSTSTPSGGFLK